MAKGLKIFLDMTITLCDAFEEAEILHYCDVSFSNIVHVNIEGLLIDWGASCKIGESANLIWRGLVRKIRSIK